MKRTLQVLVLSMAMSNASFGKGVCNLQSLTLPSTVEDNGTTELSHGAFQIKLLESSTVGSGKVPVWTGGIEVRHNDRVCVSKVGIIENPIAFAGSRHLYVSTYNGDDLSLYVLDLTNCSVAWKSHPFLSPDIKLHTNSVRLEGKKVRVNGDCLPARKSAALDKSDAPDVR